MYTLETRLYSRDFRVFDGLICQCRVTVHHSNRLDYMNLNEGVLCLWHFVGMPITFSTFCLY